MHVLRLQLKFLIGRLVGCGSSGAKRVKRSMPYYRQAPHHGAVGAKILHRKLSTPADCVRRSHGFGISGLRAAVFLPCLLGHQIPQLRRPTVLEFTLRIGTFQYLSSFESGYRGRPSGRRHLGDSSGLTGSR